MPSFTIMTGMKRGRSADDGEEDACNEWRQDVKRQRNDTLTDNIFQGAYPENCLPGTGFSSTTMTRPPIHRAHTLPFRLPSDPCAHGYTSPAATPTPSEHSADSGSPTSLTSSPAFVESEDVNMNEDNVSIVGSQSPTSPYQQQAWTRPAKLNPQSLYQNHQSHLAVGRIPTPIHPNFLHGMPSPVSTQPSPWERNAAIAPLLSSSYPPNHPMPSPIREDVMDDSPAYLAASTQLSQLSVEDGMEVDDAMQMVPLVRVEPPIGLPPRKGRARSDAITEKKRIFMGYLEGCEKCRNKTPGHLAHFLPT